MSPSKIPFQGHRSCIWWHGTATPDTFDVGDVVYLTDHADEAYAYAIGIHKPGAPAAANPQVLKVTTRGGRTQDISTALDEALANNEDFDGVIVGAIGKARKAGYRYLFYHHPSYFPEHDEQNVLVSLYPKEDLSLRGFIPVKKAKTSGEE